MGNFLKLEYFRKGMSGNIYGLFDKSDNLIHQCPAEDEDHAISEFSKRANEIKSEGYEYILHSKGRLVL